MDDVQKALKENRVSGTEWGLPASVCVWILNSDRGGQLNSQLGGLMYD